MILKITLVPILGKDYYEEAHLFSRNEQVVYCTVSSVWHYSDRAEYHLLNFPNITDLAGSFKSVYISAQKEEVILTLEWDKTPKGIATSFIELPVEVAIADELPNLSGFSKLN